MIQVRASQTLAGLKKDALGKHSAQYALGEIFANVVAFKKAFWSK